MVAAMTPSIRGTCRSLQRELQRTPCSKFGFVMLRTPANARGICINLDLRRGVAGGNDDVRMWTRYLSLSSTVNAVAKDPDSSHLNDHSPSGKNGNLNMSMIGKSTDIVWHQNSVAKLDRQQLLQHRGCVIWITGLSGSGKSTLACALSTSLHSRGKLTYILDGDNVRHALNRDLGFQADDRAENIRRIGEVAKLFADAGVICIASLISPYRSDRDGCRAILPDGDFIEVFMDVPLQVCESRDPKGLYKLARAGKIKGFSGIDDPYEPPLNCEIVLKQKEEDPVSPCEMAETVINYLESRGYLRA